MQRSPKSQGFTLIEMITVITVIAILSGLVLSIGGLVQNKGYRAKAQGDIVALTAACESYKTDNGGFPQDTVTNTLDSRTSGNPATGYPAASLFLYKQLTGDDNANGKIDTSETGRKYASDFFKPGRLNSSFRTTNVVTYIADPWGNSYGYSTAGLDAEQKYRASLESNASAERASTTLGYNPTFDLWSTAGTTTATTADVAKWIKNW